MSTPRVSIRELLLRAAVIGAVAALAWLGGTSIALDRLPAANAGAALVASVWQLPHHHR